MSTGANAKLSIEVAADERDFYELTDSGDHKLYPFDEEVLSVQDKYETEVRPNGVVTGINMVSPASGDDTVQSAVFTAYLAGLLVSVQADTEIAVTRGAGSTTAYIINSVVCDSDGNLSAIVGMGAESAFSTERGIAGGPPSVPTDSIEIAQIRLTSETAGPVLADEIFQSAEGGQCERYDFPLVETISTLGEGNKAENDDKTHAYLEFNAALPVIHGATATASPTSPKKVYAKTYEPMFTDVREVTSWTDSQISGSGSSTPYFGGVKGSESESIDTASFSALFEDGISDTLKKLVGKRLTFRFFQNKNRSPFTMTQGKMYLKITHKPDEDCQGTGTVVAQNASVGFDE